MSVFIDVHTHSPDNLGPLSIFNYMLANKDAAQIPASLFSAGLHPWDIANAKPGWQHELENLCIHPELVAIGETGIDLSRGESLDEQRSIFETHLKLASFFDLPVILHCVRAHGEILRSIKSTALHTPIIFHGFENGWKQAVKLLDAGLYISFGKVLLYPSHPAAEVFKRLPLDRVLFETDTYEGDVSNIYKVASHILQIPLETLAEQITINVNKIFNLDV
jgi:TatD DNase family protein